jgi:serine/threonine protein kinase
MSNSIVHVPCGAYANESERRALEFLMHRLIGENTSGKWVLLTNLCISLQNSVRMPHEIDILAIGSAGILAIEVKHWDRRFLESTSNVDIVRAESQKAQRKAQLLKTRLKSIPAVKNLFIPAKFLFTGAERERYAGALTTPQLLGIPAYGMVEWQELLELRGQSALDEGEINAIVSSLSDAIPRASHPRMNTFADYRECELIGHGELSWRRTYRARKLGTGDRVVLHLYDLSASTEPEARNVARREYEALRCLQKLDCVPSLMESFQPVPGFDGEMYYFSYSDPLATPFAKKIKDVAWVQNYLVSFARSCVEQLSRIHGSADDAVLHRRISPATLLVRSNNTPILIGFEFARLPGTGTVASAAPRDLRIEPWLAPEIVAGGLDLASTKSDIFALTTILCEGLSGIEGEEAAICRKVLSRGHAESPQERPEARQLTEALSDELKDPVDIVVPTTSQNPVAPEYWDSATVRELNERQYRIVQPLGRGYFGFTFKVEEIDSRGEPVSGPYVAKAITHSESGAAACRAYSQVRAQTGGPCLAGVLEVASEWRPDEITALLKWIDGDSLDTLVGVLPILFEEHDIPSLEEGIRQWLLELLRGLLVLHKVGMVHGDVSTRNIIVNDLSVTLTDYDLARREGEHAAGGTALYSSPEVDMRGPLMRSTDVYSLVATMFHAIFEAQPFKHSHGVDKSRGLNWPLDGKNKIPSLVSFFERATHPNQDKRFVTADEAIAFLTTGTPVFGAVKPEDTVANSRPSAGEYRSASEPWLLQLLKTHPASPYGNPETRGLDSPFARDTYVESQLDHVLARDIRNGSIKLVFLCGNAGDGKTALLQNLAENLGAPRETSARRIWEFKSDNGLTIRINLDGAASYEGKSATELLTNFLATFRNGVPDDGAVHLIAINDGPLLAWVECQEPSWLTEQIEALLDDGSDTAPDPRLRFINLNQRSLVGNLVTVPEVAPKFLNRLLDKMLGTSQTWSGCANCISQNQCVAWQSVQDLRHPDAGPYIRKQLTRLLQAIHQRGEVHITARLLRSTVSFGFFGTEYCSDIHAQPEKKRQGYWDRFFAPQTPYRQGELLEELTRLDPALESHPQVDRILMTLPMEQYELGMDPATLLASRRRSAYFAWNPLVKPREIDDEHVLDTGLLRRLEAFQSLVDPERAEVLCRQICDGISRMQDLPETAFHDAEKMPLLVTPRTPTETLFWVLKSRKQFRLEPDFPTIGQELDFLHTQASLTYTFMNGHVERLSMGLSLFSLLLDIYEGYQLTNGLSDDVFANLAVFSQRLSQEEQDTLFAWNPSDVQVLRIGTRFLERDGNPLQQLYFEAAGASST